MSIRAATELTAGIVLILEGAAVVFLAVTFLFMGAAKAGIGWVAFLMLLAGACMAWAGTVLAGFVHPDTKAAAACSLIVGSLLSVLMHGFMLVASCGGGVNCPATMPVSVYTVPATLAVFNVVAAVLLWVKRRKQAS